MSHLLTCRGWHQDVFIPLFFFLGAFISSFFILQSNDSLLKPSINCTIKAISPYSYACQAAESQHADAFTDVQSDENVFPKRDTQEQTVKE